MPTQDAQNKDHGVMRKGKRRVTEYLTHSVMLRG